jgi:HEAT repeat protein
VAALAKFPGHSELIAKLAAILASDPSDRVRAAAAEALGAFVDSKAEAAAALLPALDVTSHDEVVRGAALGALAQLGEPRAWQRALRFAAYGAPADSRSDAFYAIAVLGRTAAETSGDAAFGAKRKGEALRLLLGYLDDPDYEVRGHLYGALAELGDERGQAALDRAAANGEDFFERRRASRAAKKLRESLQSSGDLAGRLGRLEEESAKLRRELDALRAEREGGVD